MHTKIIEATQPEHFNWGKFLLGRPDLEWDRRVAIEPGSRDRLLVRTGWTPQHLWVLDLQTGEGAFFLPAGCAPADLEKHRIWVCPMFKPFLCWLYEQDLSDLDALPDLIEVPAEFALAGHRHGGDSA